MKSLWIYSNRGRKSHPCCTQDAIVNQRQWWNDANGVSASLSGTSIFSFFSSSLVRSNSSVSYGLCLNHIRKKYNLITYFKAKDYKFEWFFCSLWNTYLAIPYMTTETENPAKIINNQTFRDSGSKNANRLTDFSGAFTNKILIPRSRNGIEKSTTYRIESFCYISNLFHSLNML